MVLVQQRLDGGVFPLAEGPVGLTFYRGAWCPYCNLALRARQQHYDAIRKRGARLVAVSPQVPDESLSLTRKHDLAFEILSSIGSDTAKQYGIAFDLSDALAALYDRRGFDLQRVNAGHARTLPLPATYVIDRTGIIRWAFVDTDYTVRKTCRHPGSPSTRSPDPASPLSGMSGAPGNQVMSRRVGRGLA